MSEIKGCAFICDEHGTITHVLKDDFDMIPGDIVIMFVSLIYKNSVSSALNMLAEVRSNKVAFDYRLELKYKNEADSLYFMSMAIGNEFLIIGADNHHEAMELSKQIHQINNEQTNQIRNLTKQVYANNSKESEELFDEISKLNNELVNTQRELNRKNAQLHQLNEIKNRFISMAAHDLRNPLNSILLYSEFIEREATELNDTHRDFIGVIKGSTNFMISLINDLLEFGKIESGKVDLDISTFDLCELIEKAVFLHQVKASEKNIDIKIHSTPKTAQIYADVNKIEQVFHNLIGNAIKFSFIDSTININLSEEAHSYVIQVENTGPGIAEDSLESIFKPFSKSETGTADEKGSGLGLFIVKRIVDAHNGEIRVSSTPGKQTKFEVEIPKSETR